MVYDLDSKRDRIALERIKVKQIDNSTSLIAVGKELNRKLHYECGTWFIIRPANNSREYSIFAAEREAKNCLIKHMDFATNQHILT